MFSVKNLKMATKLGLLMGGAILGLLVFGAISYTTISEVRVGGPLHKQMIRGSDLNADLQPALLDVEQVRFPVFKMILDVQNKELFAKDIALYHERKKSFIDSNESWGKILDGKTKDVMSQCYAAGTKYMQIVD